MLLFGVSCEHLAPSEKQCFNSVKTAFPNSEIYIEPESNYNFVVVDSNCLKMVSTTNLWNANISEIIVYRKMK